MTGTIRIHALVILARVLVRTPRRRTSAPCAGARLAAFWMKRWLGVTRVTPLGAGRGEGEWNAKNPWSEEGGLLGPGGLLNDLTLLKSTYLGINKC
jgi:hypothetical protein